MVCSAFLGKLGVNILDGLVTDADFSEQVEEVFFAGYPPAVQADLHIYRAG